MKIAVSASQPQLDAPVDPRFGRCPYFLIVDSETMEFEVIENQGAMAGSGAGIQAAQLVANAGAEAVVAGNFGPNAFHTLTQAGLTLYSAQPGMTVRQAVEAVKNGQLPALGGPSVGAHAGIGMGGGMGMGMGRGMGRGMGMGRGRGMGMGGGWGMGGPGAVPLAPPAGPVPPPGPVPPAGPVPPGPPMGPGWQQPAPEPATIEALKQQLDMLQQQIEAIRKQLERLEGNE